MTALWEVNASATLRQAQGIALSNRSQKVKDTSP